MVRFPRPLFILDFAGSDVSALGLLNNIVDAIRISVLLPHSQGTDDHATSLQSRTQEVD